MKKTYTKTHTNPKAATSHLKKIKARGGNFKITRNGKKTRIEYSFKK